MRLLASADIHLGSPIRSAAMRNPELGDRLKQATRNAFIRTVDLAISESVDALVLAGDIFDKDQPDLKTCAFLLAQLTRAADANIPTMLIRGNHDALLDHGAHGDLGPMIHLLHKGSPSVEIRDVWFHGLSFDAAHVSKSFLPDYPAPVQGRKNIGLMHTSLDGSPGHDPYAPCSEKDLMAHGYDLWCLGHIHAPFEHTSDSVLAVMPGIPQPRHFGERTGGTVALVELGDDAPTIERYEVGKLAFAECPLDLNECSDVPEVLRELRTGLQGLQHPEHDTAVRLRVTTGHHTTEELTSLADEVLENIDRVFLDKVKVAPPELKDNSKADDLVRLMREELNEPGFQLASKQALEELRTALPREITDELTEKALDALLEEAINEVTLSLHAGAAE
ncbi:putative DNA repair exonuclease [Stappia aggregata IAM 12614]|uniref:Putative DNA repair exonuclease n=1 Tax=Roseibium aggregatum (strain ATCC 25650 / DSM 13394 / JCM 20685 / NBRC 16684 / NCIMB 2208 / IAM 12614 / B1) TaxID=384765 RepID=A0P1W8_ROSAI|nr:DNA repair exonuclease [Roseibium aggregatum]EAV41044.1 putative DNA repair exonuclease [Stappia aggregata IAM 12614] [Roseibium aggregatum IAM 12614]